MPTLVVSWALAALIGFWELATKSGNPTPKNTESPETRPISEHTLMQPRTSSSDIEWGTPSHPLTQIYVLETRHGPDDASASLQIVRCKLRR